MLLGFFCFFYFKHFYTEKSCVVALKLDLEPCANGRHIGATVGVIYMVVHPLLQGPRTKDGIARIKVANTTHGRKTKERLAQVKQNAHHMSSLSCHCEYSTSPLLISSIDISCCSLCNLEYFPLAKRNIQ